MFHRRVAGAFGRKRSRLSHPEMDAILAEMAADAGADAAAPDPSAEE